MDINEFSRKHVFEPLGMQETGYLPTVSLRARSAPTEQRDGKWLQGEVHDPRAFRLGGVAGHAGLFATAEDIAVFAAMMEEQWRVPRRQNSSVRDGQVNDHGVRDSGREPTRIGMGQAIDVLIQPGRSHDARSVRARWGSRGPCVWMDPQLDLTVVFLSNRVHPDGDGSVNRLAARIATVAAGSIDMPNGPRSDTFR